MTSLFSKTLLIKRLFTQLSYVSLFAGSLLLVFSATCQAVAAEPSRPNVLLVITDDQGYGDVGFHGNQMLKTPVLDDLARQSVRLTNFHVDPTCAETRSALMTGRYSTRVGVWHTINGRSLLPADEVTMAEVFAENGYRTGMFGKWHLGDNWPLRPRDQGFQQTLVHGGGGVGQTPDAWGNDYFDDRYSKNGTLEPQQGYCTDRFFSAAESFIADSENGSEEPFFCYVSTNAPHGPYLVDDKYAKPYRDQGVPSPMAEFYGMIANIDENLGQLLKSLADQGKAENTLVIFMTDNGTAAGFNAWVKEETQWNGYNANMRGTKGQAYDGGHRVPCFFRWPAGKLLTDKSRSQLTAHIDLLPTLIDLCELNTPEEVAFDGESLAPLLKDDADPAPLADRTLVVNSQRVDVPEKWRNCSVMQGDWRLVNQTELYNTATDPGQIKNIADAEPERVAAMQQSYETWWTSLGASLKQTVRIPIGSPKSPVTELTCHDWHATYGEVPWNQGLIAKDLEANGYWTLEVTRAGKYEFELRDRPEGVAHQFANGSARLKVGDQQQEQTIESDPEVLRFQVDLPAGPIDLTTAIEEEDQPQHGAYYVTVRLVETG